jgi:hypothetical protein
MDETRIKRIKKSPYYLNKPLKQQYDFEEVTIFANKDITFSPARFHMFAFNEIYPITENNIIKYEYTNLKSIHGSEAETQRIYQSAIISAMKLKPSNYYKNSTLITIEPVKEADCYYYCYVGTFLVENHCEINKKIYDFFKIFSVTIELEEQHDVVKTRISLNINNNLGSWLSSSTFDLKNDPVFLQCIKELLGEEHDFSIEDIKNNIFETLHLIEFLDY